VLLRVIWSSPPSEVVFPDGEPGFNECAGYAQLTAHGPGQQFSKRLQFFRCQVFGLMEEERAVES